MIRHTPYNIGEIMLTSNQLSLAAGAIVSVFLMLIPLVPKLREYWESFSDSQKQAVNVLSLILVSVLVIIISCTTDIVMIECSQVGFSNLMAAFINALLGNGATYVAFGKTGKNIVNSINASKVV